MLTYADTSRPLQSLLKLLSEISMEGLAQVLADVC
jgi:hypothetical protein